MESALRKAEISHNDIGEKDRGTWRKFNPYNPWTEDKSEKDSKDLKIESLDDLFTDEDTNKKEEPKINPVKEKAEQQEPVTPGVSIIDGFEDVNQEEKTEKQQPTIDEEDSYDLQKELEAKFDELFGPIDDDE